MELKVESTSRTIVYDGVPCRLWEGLSEKGVPVFMLVVATVVPSAFEQSEFDRALRRFKPPSPFARSLPINLLR